MLSYGRYTDLVRADLAQAQSDSWERLGRPGTWWRAGERLAIAGESRAARDCALCRERKAALSPYGLPGRHHESGPIAAPYVDAIHRVTTDPGRLTERWLDSLRADGLEDERYVEIVGIVITVIAIDTFHRALGLPAPSLPAAQPGEPSRRRPAAARRTIAWVPTVSVEDGLDDVYSGVPHVPNVRQALSLVPDEIRNLDAIEQAHYLPFRAVGNLGSNGGRRLARPQIELIAARVSYLNDCYY
jgi:hypothetical protein